MAGGGRQIQRKAPNGHPVCESSRRRPHPSWGIGRLPPDYRSAMPNGLHSEAVGPQNTKAQQASKKLHGRFRGFVVIYTVDAATPPPANPSRQARKLG